ncbi:hypothetical protein [Aestuariibacter sp. A3R04]|nr:hypothetical protein [Aestuariibacter sp. A3R04]MBU3021612.1 hypothetical protein [Aestuariibacter sp. A3R04]
MPPVAMAWRLVGVLRFLHLSSFTDYLIIDPTARWDNDHLNRTYRS